MNHRHAVDLAEPLRYLMRASVILALWGLPALASDGPKAIRLPDAGRFPENVASASNGTLFVSSIGLPQFGGPGSKLERLPITRSRAGFSHAG
ncbi:hypothetical protein [Methylobacterium sp. WL9]|uniref:hypothetical protein n=1 Tax=Methylobacterium sp. WL9 TaxID=2603898 RepID=UPI0011C7DE8B|nr:hypothetical protein [Methylobacterium sp. WL9]TXN22426.1 hypothetical protein FV217_10990 [Methylobacterium sp. WL9]